MRPQDFFDFYRASKIEIDIYDFYFYFYLYLEPYFDSLLSISSLNLTLMSFKLRMPRSPSRL